MTVIGSHSAAELQLIRDAYKRKFGKELVEELQQHSKFFKAKSNKLHQLLVRSKADLDAGIARSAIDSKDITPLLELLCTSLPRSLVELKAAYRAIYSSELIVAMKTAFPTGPSKEVAHVTPLLVALLEGAEKTTMLTRAAQSVADAEEIRAALALSDDAETVPRLLRLLSQRTRVHLRSVVSLHGGDGDIRLQVRNRLDGLLQRGTMLLLDRSEDYYARKLHAAFYGLRKTPELKQSIGNFESLGPKGSILERAQSRSGIMTHDDTLVAIIASRHGRDLSGIAHAYHTLYRKSLSDAIDANTHSDLRKLLKMVVQNAPQYGGQSS